MSMSCGMMRIRHQYQFQFDILLFFYKTGQFDKFIHYELRNLYLVTAKMLLFYGIFPTNTKNNSTL